MSEAKFTKGEWVANGAFVSHIDLGCDAIVSGAGCKDIAYKEAEANAHLIAAAPEMYNLLEKLTSHDNCKKDIIHLLGEADKLLAKARGES